MVLKYKEFFNESVINNDDDLKNSYNARIFFKGEYYAGIKGPCSLLQAYEFFNNIIEKNK